MERTAALKIIAVQEQLSRDPEYLALLAEYHALNERMLRLFETLPEAETGLIMDYIGLLEEMHRKMLISSCI